jgi:hypothetical protein
MLSPRTGSEDSKSSVVDSSFTILSRAGRFASGWSLGPAGDDGSSRGRLVEEAAMVGDADMATKWMSLEGCKEALHGRKECSSDAETCTIVFVFLSTAGAVKESVLCWRLGRNCGSGWRERGEVGGAWIGLEACRWCRCRRAASRWNGDGAGACAGAATESEGGRQVLKVRSQEKKWPT